MLMLLVGRRRGLCISLSVGSAIEASVVVVVAAAAAAEGAAAAAAAAAASAAAAVVVAVFQLDWHSRHLW